MKNNKILAWVCALVAAFYASTASAVTSMDDLFTQAQTDIGGLSVPYKALIGALIVFIVIGVGFKFIKRGGSKA